MNPGFRSSARLLTLGVILHLTWATALPALILVGKGNAPVKDPGWPAGTLEVANMKQRVGWWEGPPFGGGLWTFEYHGDQQALQTALELAAAIESDVVEVVIHNESRSSFVLRDDPDFSGKNIPWTLTVWVPQRWQQLAELSSKVRAVEGMKPGAPVPAPRLDVYLGSGGIDWSAIRVPERLKVIDRRLESNGLGADDGGALRGRVIDMETHQPVAGATVTLGDRDVGQTRTNTEGRFLLKKIPEGNYQLTVGAAGYAGRRAGHFSFSPVTYHETEVAIAPEHSISGRVIDETGAPLTGVRMRIANVTVSGAGHYPISRDERFTTDDEGRFRLDQLPRGEVTFASQEKQWYHNSVRHVFETGDEPVMLTLQPTGMTRVTVTDTLGAPIGMNYIVEIAPVGDQGIGSWGGTANVSADGTVTFEGVPPGEYTIRGRPNPGSPAEETAPVRIRITGGDVHSITLIDLSE